MSSQHHRPKLLWLILLISFPSASSVFISPALPAISHHFGTSDGYTQQLITLFIVGYALGQLLYSPFSNRYGRKVAAYIGISLFLLSCLICLAGIYWDLFHLILFGRFIMALGSSAGMIISFTIINDYFEVDEARSIVGYTVLSYALMPAVAMLAGGIITSNLSWVDCFYFYVLYGLIVLFAIIKLPETLKKTDKNALQFNRLLKGYLAAFRCGRLVLFSLIFGIMAAFVYVTASEAPFIGIEQIGLSPELFGWLILLPYLGQAVGSTLSGKLGRSVSAYKVMSIGLVSVLMGTAVMFIAFYAGYINAYTLLIPIFFVMLGGPMTFSNASVLAVSSYADKANGSAVMSFITMSVCTIGVLLLTQLTASNPIVLPGLYFGLLAIGSMIFILCLIKYPN